MPYERNYYVICDDNCKFPAMTAEQVLAAIAEATGNTPSSVDNAFITKIKEKNGNSNLKFWVGTQAQYNALTPEENTFYIITDSESEAAEQAAAIAELAERINLLEEKSNTIIEEGTIESSGLNYRKYFNGDVEIYGKIKFSDLEWTRTTTGSGYKRYRATIDTDVEVNQNAASKILTASISTGTNGVGVVSGVIDQTGIHNFATMAYCVDITVFILTYDDNPINFSSTQGEIRIFYRGN